nr:hypothetical protein CFP56_09595 [Quercus suber]
MPDRKADSFILEAEEHSMQLPDKEHLTIVRTKQLPAMSNPGQHSSKSEVLESTTMLKAEGHSDESEVAGNSFVPEVKYPQMRLEAEDVQQDHLDTFGDFFRDLNQATRSALPSNLRRYSSVHALLIRWQDDDLGTEKEIDALDDVLKNVYRYKTEKYLIPSHDSSWQLQYRVSDFRNAHDKATSLLIVYYRGHGRLESRPNKASKSIWQANEKSRVHLIWSNIQGILEQAEGDVLFILDCCYAATAARGRGAKEGLWACNSEATTTGVNDNSFTQNLIAELRSSSSERFNAAMLHNRLMRRYLEPGDHELLTEPMYSCLGGEIYPSVELVPQPQAEDESTDPALSVDTMLTEPLVVLAIKLKESNDVPSLPSWLSWVHENAPDSVESVHALGGLERRSLVHIEGHFRSDSRLVLVSLPIRLWNQLPRRAAYSFVGFVRSSNLLLSTPQWQLDSLAGCQIGRGEDEAKAKTGKEFLDAAQSKISAHRQDAEEVLQVDDQDEVTEPMSRQALFGKEKLLRGYRLSLTTSLNTPPQLPKTHKASGNLNWQARAWTQRVMSKGQPSTLMNASDLALAMRLRGKYPMRLPKI